jgi:hypothetical protein
MTYMANLYATSLDNLLEAYEIIFPNTADIFREEDILKWI